MAERIEVNPGEFFMVDPESLHVKEYETVFALTGKIGSDRDPQLAYMMSFTGRINNTDRERVYTIMMSPQDAFNMLGTMLEQFEWLEEQIQKSDGRYDAN